MNLSSRFPVSDRSKVKRLPKRGSQEQCMACKGRGWLQKKLYHQAPEDLKKGAA